MRVFIAILLFASALSAAPCDSMIARLAESTWLPAKVHAEWQTSGITPVIVGKYNDWKLADQRSTRLAGSMIISLARTSAAGVTERTAVSGNLRIVGPSLMVKHTIQTGAALQASDIEVVQADWTHLPDGALQDESLKFPCVAVHSLVPGRALTVRDVKSVPRIRRGQSVELVYMDGAVRVRLNGRALRDGAVGDRVPVTVDMGTSRKFDGCVTADGTVQLVR
jgi:flagella basal body P-ring formation protein FlgA